MFSLRNRHKKSSTYFLFASLMFLFANVALVAGINNGGKSHGHIEAEKKGREDACPATLTDPKNEKKYKMDVFGKANHPCCGCNPGFKLTGLCEVGKPDTTKCEPCESGTFIEEYAHGKRTCIKDNRTCPYDQYYVPSKPETNSQCVCKVGFKAKDEVVCRPHGKCPPGSGVYILGNEYRDTQCELCLHGFESPDNSSTQRCKITKSVLDHKNNQGISFDNSSHLMDNATTKTDLGSMYGKSSPHDETTQIPGILTTAFTEIEVQNIFTMIVVPCFVVGLCTIIGTLICCFIKKRRKSTKTGSAVTYRQQSRQSNREDQQENPLLSHSANELGGNIVNEEYTSQDEEDFDDGASRLSVSSLNETANCNQEASSEQPSQPGHTSTQAHQNIVSNISEVSQPSNTYSPQRYAKQNSNSTLQKEDAKAVTSSELHEKTPSTVDSLICLSSSYVDGDSEKHSKTTPFLGQPTQPHYPNPVRTLSSLSPSQLRARKMSEMYYLRSKLNVMVRDEVKKFFRNFRNEQSSEQIIDDLDRNNSSTSEMFVEAFFKLMELGFDAFNPRTIKDYFTEEGNLHLAAIVDECIKPETWNTELATIP